MEHFDYVKAGENWLEEIKTADPTIKIGKSQSPIDFPSEQAMTYMAELGIQPHYTVVPTCQLEDNGHTAIVSDYKRRVGQC